MARRKPEPELTTAQRKAEMKALMEGKAPESPVQAVNRQSVDSLTPEIIEPGQSPAGWSLADPSAMDRLIRAILKADGNFDIGVRESACPLSIAESLRGDPQWPFRFQQIAHTDIYLAKYPGTLKAAMDVGGGYILKVGHDITPKSTLDELQASELRSLRVGGRAARLRALDDIIKEAERQKAMLMGGNKMGQAEIQAIIDEVSAGERKAVLSK